MGKKGSSRQQIMPGQGRGHAMLQTAVYQSEEDTSGSFHSEGLTGAAFHDTGRYELLHSGGSGGLSFSSGGKVKVMIEGGYQSFHRDEIAEHKRPGYYTVRR